MTPETLVLPFAPASASVARAAVHNALGRHGVVQHRREDAALVVSELVGNSVRHGHSRSDGTLLVAWWLTTEELVVEVSDGGDGEPVLQPLSPDAVDGRGLTIVDSLARRWGTRYDGEGTTVWAVLRVPPAMREGDGALAAGAHRSPARHRKVHHPQQGNGDLGHGGQQLVG